MKERSILYYICYYNKFIDEKITIRPPVPPNKVKINWRPWKTDKVNRIIQENYKKQMKAYKYCISLLE